MPSFTSQIPDLQVTGPIVQVQVGPSAHLVQAMTAQGHPVPPSIQVNAMIDTGASGTVVTPSVIQHIGLQPVGMVQMSTPSTTTPQTMPQFNISLVFPNNVNIASAIATQAPLGGQQIQCLIGRDILAHAVLVYIGYTNQFTLSF